MTTQLNRGARPRWIAFTPFMLTGGAPFLATLAATALLIVLHWLERNGDISVIQ